MTLIFMYVETALYIYFCGILFGKVFECQWCSYGIVIGILKWHIWLFSRWWLIICHLQWERGQILYYIDPSVREKLSLNMKTGSSDRFIRHWAVLRWFSVLEAFNYRLDFVVEVEEQYRVSGTQVGSFLPLSVLLYNNPARWLLFSIWEMSKLRLWGVISAV